MEAHDTSGTWWRRAANEDKRKMPISARGLKCANGEVFAAAIFYRHGIAYRADQTMFSGIERWTDEGPEGFADSARD